MTIDLRLATPDDIPSIARVIEASVRELSVGYYSPQQVEGALRSVFGPDSQLIADGTYYVIEADGKLVAAGGWSRRGTLYGGDQAKVHGGDALLDPSTAPARIRAFFVHPAWARRGLARQLFAACVAAAREAGFRQLELAATLPGVPLYRALGFDEQEPLPVTLPDGTPLPTVRMTRPIDGVNAAESAKATRGAGGARG